MLDVSSEWFRRPLNRIPPMIALQTLAPADRDEMNHGPSTLIFRASSTRWSLPRAQATASI